MGKKKNWIGHKFGQLVVLEETSKRKYRRPSIVFLCQCSCGNKCEIAAAQFSSTLSCGCRKKEVNKQPIGLLKAAQDRLLPPGESAFRTLLSRYKKSATKRKLSFSLLENNFKTLVQSNCFYCNTKPLQQCFNRKSSSSFTYNGIDRVDNKVGYELYNCVSCCFRCNRAKDTMTTTDFKSWITSVFVWLTRSL